MSNAETDKDMLPEEQAGVYLGGDDDPIPPKTLRQWRYFGKGPAYVKIGRHVRYRVADLDAFIAAQRTDPSKAA